MKAGGKVSQMMSDLQMWEENALPINTLHVGMHARAYEQTHTHTHPWPNPQAHNNPALLATGVAAGTEWQLSWSVVWASSQLASSKHMLHNEKAKQKHFARNFPTLHLLITEVYSETEQWIKT